MESEKVKEIKKALEYAIQVGLDKFSLGASFSDCLTLINELESENKQLLEVNESLNGSWKMQLKKIAELETLCNKTYEDLTKEIDRLQSKNDEQYKRIMELEQDLVHADEKVFYRECNVTLRENEIKEQALKQFAERLKEDFIKKKNGLLKAREIGASNDNFIMVDSLNCKIDGLQYAIDNIDETLKECLKK